MAEQAIHQAISIGVPLFNGGDANGCYETYRDCAKYLISRAPSGLPRGGEARLQAGLDAATSGSAQDRAWAMRHSLDDVLSMMRSGGGGSGGSGRSLQATPVPAGSPATADILDFSDPALQWMIVDDRVMGGSSRSRVSALPSGGGAAFEGELVVSGGGFASCRCVPPRGALGQLLRGAQGIVLVCSGDGRSGYKLTLKTDAAMDGIMYQAAFSAPSGPLRAVRLPLSAFRANFRGQPVPNAPPLRGEDCVQVGLMLSRFSDGGRVEGGVQPGGFRLQVASLEAER